MLYLKVFLPIAIIHFLALVSPGPDFVLIVKNSLSYSKRLAVFTALGLAMGITVHVCYTLLGIAVIISKSILIFSVIKTLGAAYLIYIGLRALKSNSSMLNISGSEKVDGGLMAGQAIRMGFLCNVLNPKVTIFFLAVFTQIIKSSTPLYVQILYGAEMAVMTFVWFAFVARIFSLEMIRSRFYKIQKYLEKTMGAILILLGIKLILSKR